jgi:phosphoglycolate phosphatase
VLPTGGAVRAAGASAARRPAEVVLLDLDGVLADSRLAITSCMNHALASAGREPVPPSDLYPLIGPSLAYGFSSLLGVEPDDPSVASCIAAYRSVYAEVSLRDTPTYPGVPEALDAIASAVPGRRLAVATSKPRAFAEPLIEALGLRDRFVAVFAPELDLHVESKTATVAKALAALRADGLPAAMVGDRYVDVQAAHAHGLRAVGVTWGFGTVAELRDAGADVVVAEPADLPAAV